MKRRTFAKSLVAAGLAAPPVLGQATVEVKTPGVYINEQNAFPNSVVEVATAVPAFIGYTETATNGTTDLRNVPTRLTSMAEFQRLFGGPPVTKCEITVENGQVLAQPDAQSRFLLYHGMQMFFENGGGPCWVVSVGGYGTDTAPVEKGADHFAKAWEGLAREPEPTMVVVPDAVLLSVQDYARVSNEALAHCAQLQSRIAILDVFDGDRPRTYGTDDVISGATGFRSVIRGDALSYGVAYYPWLNTSVQNPSDIGPANLTEASRQQLHDLIEAEQAKLRPGSTQITALLDKLMDADAADTSPAHQALWSVSQVYQDAMNALQAALGVMPPSAAMAGVYTRTDNTFGVFKAPANTGILSVTSPTVAISHDDQEDLNVPLDGMAINAIRTFLGRGVLIWGARTLDGNSQDYRYINVRRTLIMLEQSIKYATEAYVFAPNDASTWRTVQSMIENFLTNQWKAGALAGASPGDAFDVAVGLGSTMTANDILDGYMRVTVRVAVVRPAEFIVITFQQKMQTS